MRISINGSRFVDELQVPDLFVKVFADQKFWNIRIEPTVSNGQAQNLQKPILSLIVPTYNESQNLANLVNKVEKLLEHIPFEFIIVDDNSPDGTDQVAEALNTKYGNIKVCKRSGKLGLSSAVLYGFNNASGRILAVMDADMQHPPEILPKMYQEISNGCDLVIASRYVEGGGIRDWKLSRILYSRGATLLAHFLIPPSRRVKDVMSGCFMIKKSSLKNVHLNPIGFKILLEVLSKCDYNRVVEVPYIFVNRQNGKSNLNPKEIQNYIIHLSRLFSSFWLRRKANL